MLLILVPPVDKSCMSTTVSSNNDIKLATCEFLLESKSKRHHIFNAIFFFKAKPDKARPSEGINTQCHFRVCSDPETITHSRRAQRFRFSFLGYKVDLSSLPLMNLTAAVICRGEEIYRTAFTLFMLSLVQRGNFSVLAVSKGNR